ncbi:MAG: VanZ family protein [Coriobacteriaceae bacterium]|nr:VanZ family protein [Coriobacteriaceae bacterium]
MVLRQRVYITRWFSPAWSAASILMVLFIWANSLVPGAGSSAVSHAATSSLQTALEALGIGAGWVTNLLVRKAAHLAEYAVLGFLVMRAFGPAISRDRRWIALAALALTLAPAIDETIQVCIPGRDGRLLDVLIDCTGALIGSLVSRGATAISARFGAARKKI